jgi:phenylpropionate dioxygenase-like ring-hydroxylating dioxygenase large terminal subunit
VASTTDKSSAGNQPGLLPASAYCESATYERELSTLFTRSWLHVADTFDVPQPGDYAIGRIGRTPVVTIHGHDGELRTFINLCTHRRAQLVMANGRCERVITCPFHGWSFKTDGTLAGVPRRKSFDEAELASLNLTPLRMETVGPLVFATLNAEGPSLAEWLGPLHSTLAEAGKDPELQAPWDLHYDIAGNWKLAMEATMEGYHTPITHRSSFAMQVDVTEANHTLGDWASCSDVSTGEEKIQGRENHWYFGVIFPNLAVIVAPGEIAYHKATPRSAVASHQLVRVFERGKVDPRPRPERSAFVDQINREDIEMIERCQLGLQAQGGPPRTYSVELEHRLAHFAEVWRRVMEASPRPKST